MNSRKTIQVSKQTVSRLRILAKASELLNSSLDLNRILDLLLKHTTANLNASTGTIYLVDREKKELFARIRTDRKMVEIRLAIGKGISGYVAKTGKTVRLKDVYRDKRFYRDIDRQSGFRTKTMICAPMKNRAGHIVGVFQILNKKRGSFTSEDARFLKAISIPATIAIENARLHHAEVETQRMQRELELAAAIQQQILPKSLPCVPETQLSAFTKPCREVGGDFYDAIESDDGKLTLAIADVSGKGVAGALLVSTFQAALHTYVEFRLPLKTLAMKLNRIIFEDSTVEGFITCVLCTYDPKTRILRYVNAGHNHPMVFRTGGPGLQLDRGGIGLGMLSDVSYEEGEVVLGAHDLLFLYTDGVTEAMNADQDLYGEARLWARVREHLLFPVNNIAGHVWDDVHRFSEGVQQVDDLTMLLMRVTD